MLVCYCPVAVVAFLDSFRCCHHFCCSLSRKAVTDMKAQLANENPAAVVYTPKVGFIGYFWYVRWV